MIIGWDVSTSAIGICVKQDDGTTVEFGVIYPEGETHGDKHRSAAHQVASFCKRLCVGKVVHVVEDRLGGFSGGLTTQQTLMALAAMNAIVSFILRDFGEVIHIPPVTTKRIMGLRVPKGANKKEMVVELARAAEPTFPYSETKSGNWVKGTDDMADAWLLAEAGGKLLRGEATLGSPKKAQRRRKKAGSGKDPGEAQG